MIDTGLEPNMSVAFGGVSKMLTGKGIAYGCARTATWSYWHRGVS